MDKRKLKIHWQPTEKQSKALVRPEDEILFGGARGGGKTQAGIAWLLYDIDKPKFRALVIRRNSDDLKDWIDRARVMYEPTGAVFTGSPTEIRFPSGAIIRTGHLKDENAYGKYQGHEYQRMVIEELTQIPRENDYEKLIASCRSTIPGLKPQIFCTTNPDGAGYEWVRDRFDCLHPDGLPRYFPDEETGLRKSRIFIPSRVEDNPHLIENDPSYVSFLNNLKDPTLRKQWREGDWSEPLIEGSYYQKQIHELELKGRITTVPVEPRIPVETWWDLGIGDAMSIWFTQTIGMEIRVVDYYEAEGEGIPFYIRVLQDKGYIYSVHHAPHDIEVRELTSGKSRYETAISLGITFDIVANIPVADGIDAVRQILPICWFDKDRCTEGIKALRNYRKEWDEKRNHYKDNPVHDWASHAADSFRYFAVGFKKAVHYASSQNYKEQLANAHRR